jgi:hypothetical protein
LILILLLDLTCCPQTISNVCYLVFKDQLFSSTALWRQKPTLSNLQRSVKVLFFRPVDFFSRRRLLIRSTWERFSTTGAVYSRPPPTLSRTLSCHTAFNFKDRFCNVRKNKNP